MDCPNPSAPKRVYYRYLDPLLDGEQGMGAWEPEEPEVQVYQDVAPSSGGKGSKGSLGKGQADKGRSGAEAGLERPQWQQLLRDCVTLGISQVQIQRWEDLGESLEAVAQRLQELDDRGIALMMADAGSGSVAGSSQASASVGQPVGQPLSKAAVLKILREVQQQELSRKIRKGHARNRIRALPPPGRAPYGYRRGKDRYVIDRSTAPVVKEFFDQFILYGSLRGAVRHIAKKYNKRISASTGQRWLQNPVYRGDLGYKNGEVVTDTHGAIISREEAAQVDRLLRRNRQMAPRTASAPRSLAGLVSCSHCGSATTVVRTTRRGTDREYLYLRPMACPGLPSAGSPSCPGLPDPESPSPESSSPESPSSKSPDSELTSPESPGSKSSNSQLPNSKSPNSKSPGSKSPSSEAKCKAVPYEPLLQAVIERICEDLPQAVSRLNSQGLSEAKAGLEGAIAAKERILVQLPELEEQGILDADTAALRRYRVRTELATLRGQLAQLPPVNLQELSQTVAIAQFWLDLSESERRFFFREFIQSIELVRDQSGQWQPQLKFIF